MKKIFLLLMISTFAVQAQDSIPFTKIREEVERNIIFYRIYYLEGQDFCRNDVSRMISGYLPDRDKNYDFTVDEIDASIFPDPDIRLYDIRNNYYVIKKLNPDQSTVVSFVHGKGYEDILSEKILIGYYSKTNSTVFISGNIMKDCIASKFNLNIKNGESFYPFLRLKLYNFNVENFSFIKRKNNHLLFRASTKNLGDIEIKVDTADFDNLQVRNGKAGTTYKGSYKWHD